MRRSIFKTNRFYTRLYSFTVALLLIPAGFLVVQSRRLNIAEQLLSATYANAFHESITNLEQLSASLHGGAYTDGSIEKAAEVWKASGAAKASLDLLPPTTSNLDKIYNYLSQVGDYAYKTTLEKLDGKEGPDEKNISALTKFNDTLLQKLSELASKYDGGRLPIGTLEDANVDSSLQNQISGGITDDMTYPSLNYDGKTSDHLKQINYALLENAKDISGDEAKNKAAQLLKTNPEEIKRIGATQGTLKTYTFSKGDMTIDVTAKGGYPAVITNGRAMSEGSLKPEQAIEIAGRFLNDYGFSDLLPYSYTDSENVVYCEFVSAQDGVLMLPDKVFISISKDSGEVAGLTAKDYIENHIKDRKNLAPALTEAEAKAKLNATLSPQTGRLVIVDSDGGFEQLCYEFKVTKDDVGALTYVDAATGKQKKTQMIDGKVIL